MMSDSMKADLKHLIVDHEDYRRLPYLDIYGNITIGIGYNLSTRGLPDSWINNQYDDDVNYFYSQLLKDFAWYQNLNQARQIALIDMCFMGYKKFCGFTKMLNALANDNYKEAAAQIIHSEWYEEVKERGVKIADIIYRGEL